MRWLFPSNKRAERSTVGEQASKVVEEAGEVLQALSDGEPDWRVIEEALDTVQACEGLLRKFPASAVIVGKARVKLKSRLRGDYA